MNYQGTNLWQIVDGTLQWAVSSNLQAGIYKVLGNPLMIISIGLVEGAAYFFSFKYLIKKMNLGTPGREEEVIGLQKTVKHNAKKKTSQEQLSTNNNVPGSGQTDSKFVTSQNSVNQQIDIQKYPNGPLKLAQVIYVWCNWSW